MKKFLCGNFTIFIILSFLVVLSSGRTSMFGFWKDDWIIYWVVKTQSWKYFVNWVHPGYNLYFLVLSNLLHPDSLIWHLLGIGWKISASISVYFMVRKMFPRDLIGFLAPALFASTPLGLDTVGWITATVSNMDITALCWTIIVFIDWMKNTSRSLSIKLLLLFFITIFLDPFRMLPLGILLTILFFQTSPELLKALLQKSVKYSLIILLLILVLLIWQFPRVQDLSTFQALKNHGWSTAFVISKSYVVGNFISSLGNILLGPFVKITEISSNAEYNRTLARLSFIAFGFLAVWSVMLSRQKYQYRKKFIFFLIWIPLFYLPNWVAEPRLTLGVTHRYFSVSSIGWLILIVLGITSLPKQIRFILIGFCVVWMIYLSNLYINDWEQYRLASVQEHIFASINQEVSAASGLNVFYFHTESRYYAQNLIYAGSVPFALQRNIHDFSLFPIITNNEAMVLSFLCQDSVREVYGKKKETLNKLPLSQIYSWNIAEDGSIASETDLERKRLLNEAKSRGCTIKE